MKLRYETTRMLGLWIALGMVPTMGSAGGGEVQVELSVASSQAETDAKAARVIDRSSGAALDGTLEVTFASGTTKLNPAALNNVQWESDGESVTGRLLGPVGQELAVMSGVIGDNEMSGNFRDAAGRTGTWRFTGILPDMR